MGARDLLLRTIDACIRLLIVTFHLLEFLVHGLRRNPAAQPLQWFQCIVWPILGYQPERRLGNLYEEEENDNQLFQSKVASEKLTKLMAISVASGTHKQITATFRHAITLPSRKTMKKPSAAEMPEQAVRMPRTDGWLRNGIQFFSQHHSIYCHQVRILPNFANVRDDRRLGQPRAEAKQHRCHIHLGQCGREVQNDPGDDMRKIDNK